MEGYTSLCPSDLVCHSEERIQHQTHDHHTHAVYGQTQCQSPQQAVLDVLHVPPPSLAHPPPTAVPGTDTARADAATSLEDARAAWLEPDVSIIAVIGVHVVVFLGEPLVMDTIRVADLVVEQPGKDEADGRRSRGADVGQHTVQLADSEGGDICHDDDDCCEKGETHVGHRHSWRTMAIGWPRAVGKEGAVARGVWTTVGTIGSPPEHCIERGSARMNLEWNAEHDQHDDGSLADGGGCGRRIHHDDVAQNGVAKGQVARDCDQDVDACCGSDAGRYDTNDAGWRVILDFVDDGEHLRFVSRGATDEE